MADTAKAAAEAVAKAAAVARTADIVTKRLYTTAHKQRTLHDKPHKIKTRFDP